MTGYLWENELEMAKQAGTAWYRSKDRVPIKSPFLGGGYMSSKKWPLIEVIITQSQWGLLILRKNQNKVETTNRCEALKEVMSMNVQY